MVLISVASAVSLVRRTIRETTRVFRAAGVEGGGEKSSGGLKNCLGQSNRVSGMNDVLMDVSVEEEQPGLKRCARRGASSRQD
jgi:hypothetical protein